MKKLYFIITQKWNQFLILSTFFCYYYCCTFSCFFFKWLFFPSKHIKIMFKVFKLILNINIERKVCSHHTVQFCETEQKPIRYDVNMVLIKEVYKWIYFACITPSNSFVPFTVFLPYYSLHIFISWGISQSGISWTTNNGAISLNLA